MQNIVYCRYSLEERLEFVRYSNLYHLPVASATSVDACLSIGFECLNGVLHVGILSAFKSSEGNQEVFTIIMLPLELGWPSIRRTTR